MIQVRLGSVVEHGVGGPESGALNFIYSYYLDLLGENNYNYISINQIGNELNEFIRREGKKIHINIRYPTEDDFELKAIQERNLIRLDVMQTSLVRIAEFENKLNIDNLLDIHNIILKNNFNFEIIFKTFVYKKRKEFSVDLLVNPRIDRFVYYALFKRDNIVISKVEFYHGGTSLFYMLEIAQKGEWTSENNFSLTGKKSGAEIRFDIGLSKYEVINLTPYDKPPYFEMMRLDIQNEEKMKAMHDFQVDSGIK